QMPLPLLTMACLPGSHGPSWGMLPGTYSVASAGVPGGASTRNVTATGRTGTVSWAGAVTAVPSGFAYAKWATTFASRGDGPVGAGVVGVTGVATGGGDVTQPADVGKGDRVGAGRRRTGVCAERRSDGERVELALEVVHRDPDGLPVAVGQAFAGVVVHRGG